MMHCRVKRELIVVAATLVKTPSSSFIKRQSHNPASGSPADLANHADPSGGWTRFFTAGNTIAIHSTGSIPADLHKRCPVILNPDSPENNTFGK